MNKSSIMYIATAMLLMLAGMVVAGPVSNGNDTARYFTNGSKERRAELRKEHTGRIHTFRYLKIEEMEWIDDKERRMRLETVEPSSDMRVILKTRGSVSRKLAHKLETGDCVAAKGRIKSLGEEKTNIIVVEPAILRHKDRDVPKAGQELRREVDPQAH